MPYNITTNSFYSYGAAAFLEGNIDVFSDTIYVSLVSASYTPSSDHQFFDTSVDAFVCAPPVAITSKGIAVGNSVAPGGAYLESLDSASFPGVTTGQEVRNVVLWKSGSAGVDDYVIAVMVTGSDDTAINFTTNGGGITIGWYPGGVWGSAPPSRAIFGLICGYCTSPP